MTYNVGEEIIVNKFGNERKGTIEDKGKWQERKFYIVRFDEPIDALFGAIETCIAFNEHIVNNKYKPIQTNYNI